MMILITDVIAHFFLQYIHGTQCFPNQGNNHSQNKGIISRNKRKLFKVVYDRKRFWYQEPNQGPISVSVLGQIFFSETETFFFYFLWDMNFYKLENKANCSKIILKYFEFGSKSEKNISISITRFSIFSIEMWFPYRLRHRPKVSANLGFRFWHRTLTKIVISVMH